VLLLFQGRGIRIQERKSLINHISLNFNESGIKMMKKMAIQEKHKPTVVTPNEEIIIIFSLYCKLYII
jgi:hypothetical protein